MAQSPNALIPAQRSSFETLTPPRVIEAGGLG